jgi:hypothetical protein
MGPEKQPEKKELKIPGWVLPALSWIVALYFLIGFLTKSGFPPTLTPATGAVGVPALFFLFLPFFKKIKIGKVLELEREVEKAKKELSDFKSDIRNTLSVLSTNVNTIGRMTNQVTVNLPSLSELQRARQQVAATFSPEAEDEVRRVEDDIMRQSEQDRTMALARTRIDIERALRELLDKDMSPSPDGGLRDVKYAGVNQLFEVLLKRNPELKSLRRSFRYVTQICNAAIHAQAVSEGQAKEALALGAEILTALRQVGSGLPFKAAAN